MLTLSTWAASTTNIVRWWFKETYVSSSSCVPLSVAMLEGFFSRFWTITPYIKSETCNWSTKKQDFVQILFHFRKREADKLQGRVVWNQTSNDPGYLHVQWTCYHDCKFIQSVCPNIIVIPTILLRERWLTLNVLIINTIKNILWSSLVTST